MAVKPAQRRVWLDEDVINALFVAGKKVVPNGTPATNSNVIRALLYDQIEGVKSRITIEREKL